MPNSSVDSASFRRLQLPFVRTHDVLDGGLVLDKGHSIAPKGPGLGVKVDMNVVEKFRVAWVEFRGENYG